MGLFDRFKSKDTEKQEKPVVPDNLKIDKDQLLLKKLPLPIKIGLKEQKPPTK